MLKVIITCNSSDQETTLDLLTILRTMVPYMMDNVEIHTEEDDE